MKIDKVIQATIRGYVDGFRIGEMMPLEDFSDEELYAYKQAYNAGVFDFSEEEEGS